jgi:hypothetical protein
VRRRNRNTNSNRVVGNNIDNVDYLSYEQLIRLPNIKVGVALKTLVEKTRLYICTKKDICVICQEETRLLNDIVRELQCMHIYHAKCIDRWLVNNRTCPLCNKLQE